MLTTIAIACLFAAGALKVLESASLLSAKEGFRGAGRVGGGLAWILVGISLHGFSRLGGLPAGVELVGIVFALCGLLTAASGARKFLRRNVAQ